MYSYIHIYCNEVWGNTYQSYLDPLVKIQKRALRVISFEKRDSHTDPLFKKSRLLKLNEIYVYSIQLFMFKFHHYKLPLMFYAFFTRNTDIHDYPTRQEQHLHVPLTRTHLTSSCVRNMGVKVYNHFYDILDLNCSYYTYKKNLKQYLIENEITSLL